MEWILYERKGKKPKIDSESRMLKQQYNNILQQIGNVEYKVLKQGTVRKQQKRILLLRPNGIVDFPDLPRNSPKILKRLVSKLRIYSNIIKVHVSTSILTLTFENYSTRSYESDGDYDVMELASEISERCQAQNDPLSIKDKPQLYSRDLINFSNYSLSGGLLDLFEKQVEKQILFNFQEQNFSLDTLGSLINDERLEHNNENEKETKNEKEIKIKNEKENEKESENEKEKEKEKENKNENKNENEKEKEKVLKIENTKDKENKTLKLKNKLTKNNPKSNEVQKQSSQTKKRQNEKVFKINSHNLIFKKNYGLDKQTEIQNKILQKSKNRNSFMILPLDGLENSATNNQAKKSKKKNKKRLSRREIQKKERKKSEDVLFDLLFESGLTLETKPNKPKLRRVKPITNLKLKNNGQRIAMLENRELDEKIEFALKTTIYSKYESISLRKLSNYISELSLEDIDFYAKQFRSGIDQYRTHLLKKKYSEIVSRIRDAQSVDKKILDSQIERTANAILEKSLLTPIYDQILLIFQKKFQKEDEKIKKIILNLRKKDQQFFGIKKEFVSESNYKNPCKILSKLNLNLDFDSKRSENLDTNTNKNTNTNTNENDEWTVDENDNTNTNTSTNTNKNSHKSTNAIETLNSNIKQLPNEKHQIIFQSSKSIYQTVKKENNNPVLVADDFLPIFEYVIVNSEIDHLYSLTEFLTAFSDESEMKSECGYYFVSFTIAVQHIQSITEF
ncbi:hypothetical protein M0812_21138 [Anaeramoeba flamelloides]|uniref:VPS9 domain-containing protein n=1 Tax=Anaeramoeba flamelloides TaxID=1746091 RepID=A0AAV7YR13_9EUKA|nr:hypothetical protein M0812_21138 [Anaeramoeba flamelloides]